jgi:hypothetical protein
MTPTLTFIEQAANITLTDQERVIVKAAYTSYLNGEVLRLPLSWSDKLERMRKKGLVSGSQLKQGIVQPAGAFRQALIRTRAGTIHKHLKTTTA